MVYRYVREINDAFNRRNGDTTDVIPLYSGNIPGTNTRYIAKSNIEFHLAQRDPNGQPTNGITRRRHYLSNGGDNHAKFDGWAPDSYLNIWIVNDFSDDNNAGAFAFKPAGAASIPYYDGVIAAISKLDGNANSDKTLAHEIGHSLNLSHTFGDKNSTYPKDCNGEDNVDDTPPTDGGGNSLPTGPAPSGCNIAADIYDTACTQSFVFLGRLSPDITDTFPDRVVNRGISFFTRTRVRLRAVDIYPHDTAGAPFTITLRRNGVTEKTYSGTVDSGGGRRQRVPLGFLISPDSSYTLSFSTNPNARRDSLAGALPTAQRGVPGALVITNPTTGGLYNYFYNWDVQYGYFKIYSAQQAYALYDDTSGTRPRFVDGGYLVDYPDTVNAQNIMDYQGCSKMFTNGQALRMRAALRSSIAGRNELIDSANQVQTGIRLPDVGGVQQWPARRDVGPVADFSIVSTSGGGTEKVYVCPGVPVTFFNQSWRDTTASAEWTFTGGATINPSTSINSVNNRFSTPGWVDVSLKVRGNNTDSSTITRQRVVYVADTNAKINDPLSHWTEFNPATEPVDRYPIFNYYNNEYNWSVANTGVFDGYSMRYYSYDSRTTAPALTLGSPQGDYDDFFMPPVNLSAFGGNDTLNLTFNYSSATRTVQPNDMNDIFEIAYSQNCGDSWTTFKTMTKNELHNVGSVLTYAFMPASGYASSEWAYAAVKIPAAARVNTALFRFRYRPGAVLDGSLIGSGNNFYIDRIHFSAFPAGINETNVVKTGFSLVPNPTRGGATASIKGSVAAAVMTVTDVTGKVVYTSTQPTVTTAYTSFEIPAHAVSAKGIYFVRVGQGASSHTEKLVVY